MSDVINHAWLDEAEQRSLMAASVTLPIDQFLPLIAVARNGLKPRLAEQPAGAGYVLVPRAEAEQVSRFLLSIEGAGYGGMHEYDVAAETMRRAAAPQTPAAPAEEE